MSNLSNMPAVGTIVITIIVALFALALILLFYVCGRYKRLTALVNSDGSNGSEFLHRVKAEYAEAYKHHGSEVNTPAIITEAIGRRLGGLLACERFLNNAVSLFVTLGLFGTFLGLSLSVQSLTELIGFSDTSEWLSVLDSVGGGLMSALSGMGVAFYTSLVGVACSILLTVLRAVVNPETARSRLEVSMELWLDHDVAPGLKTVAAKDEYELVRQMMDALNNASDSIESTLSNATLNMNKTLELTKSYLGAFNQTVGSFNDGVRDFNEFNYNLRGTVERMDVSLRDVVSGMREATRNIERSIKQ
ncbi:MAG: MotA/TolQ/ExbB proton channel family protein [Eubacteriales bacterium]|nr:MotA/TolQ/ExbB proton channel family protein [Eubacteriales bacterium]